MSAVRRIALPLPKCSMEDEGDDYVASLDVRIAASGGFIDTTGDMLETLLAAVGMRTLGFHARTREFIPYSLKCGRLNRAIDTGWSGIDSFAQDRPELRRFAEALQRLDQRSTGEIAWSQTNAAVAA